MPPVTGGGNAEYSQQATANGTQPTVNNAPRRGSVGAGGRRGSASDAGAPDGRRGSQASDLGAGGR